MPRARPTLTPAERARIAELHATGMSRNKIADEIGRSWSSVSKTAKELGLTWDRAAPRAAIEARRIDLAAMRAELAVMSLVRAKNFLEALDQPFLVFNFGGKDNTYEDHQLDKPPTGDIRNLMTSYGIAVQRSMDLSRFDTDPTAGGNDVDAWLDSMGA